MFPSKAILPSRAIPRPDDVRRLGHSIWRFVSGNSRKEGLSPGTVVHVGRNRKEKVRLSIIDFTDKDIAEKRDVRLEETFPFRDLPSVTWLNITGVHDTKLIEGIGAHFGIHPLIQEDIANTTKRPSFEEFSDHLFISLKMLFQGSQGEIESEDLSLIVGKNYVISFQEKEGDVFDNVRARLHSDGTRIRRSGSDYLAYALTDAVVDSYFAVLEKIGDMLEGIEVELNDSPTQETLKRLHHIKKELLFMRKSVWPFRDVISQLQKSESGLVNKKTRLYLKDVYDHTVQVIDTVETFRDMTSSMTDIYLSAMNNRLSEVMKLLTIFASIFIPLTFIAGIYGMNFEHMPELSWRYGYAMIWAVFVLVSAWMLFLFRKKKWL